MLAFILQDHRGSTIREASYSVTESGSPVSMLTVYWEYWDCCFGYANITVEFCNVGSSSNIKSVCQKQINIGTYSREGSGSPLIVAESVTSATTTHVTKVKPCYSNTWVKLVLCASAEWVQLKLQVCSELLFVGLFVCLQTVKGGYSETRIEKRIIITGDDDVDQDQVGLWCFTYSFLDVYAAH